MCTLCQTRPGEVALHLTKEVSWTAKRSRDLRRICGSCSAVSVDAEAEECDSVDCPVCRLLGCGLPIGLGLTGVGGADFV